MNLARHTRAHRKLLGFSPLVLSLVGIIAFVTGLAVPALFSLWYDDAYIHARIAENFINTGAPLFNWDARFKADSSTGYVLLIALISYFSDTLMAIRVVAFVSITLLVVSIFLLSWKLGTRRYEAFVTGIAGLPFCLLAAYGGMESIIPCLLLTLAAIASLRSRHNLVLLIVSTAVWFRFEVTVIFALVLWYDLACLRLPKGIIWYAAPMPILWLTDFTLYGSVVPHAAGAKSLAYGFPISQSLINALFFGVGPYGLIITICFLLVLMPRFAGAVRKPREIDMSDIFLFFSASVLAAWAIGRSIIFNWYYCLMVFPFALSMILRPQTASSNRSRSDFVQTYASYGFMVATCLSGTKFILNNFGLYGDEQANVRVTRYLEIGAGLYTHCPQCSLATSEIGGLGYSFKGKVFDAFGLGDPEALAFHPMRVPQERSGYGVGAIPPKYIEFRHPDFVVSMPNFAAALTASPYITKYSEYTCPIGQGQYKIWQDSSINIFSRTTLPPALLQHINCTPVGGWPR
jgi:hypothetical protein